MMPFIQVTSDATDAPIRQTVSSLGTADEELPPVPLAPELPLEFVLQPVMAMAAAAQTAAAAVTLCRTAGVLLARL
jgi:hypothetical protein